jgi:hypothetical protein
MLGRERDRMDVRASLPPADRTLGDVQVGEVVRLTGGLVDGQRDAGASIHTALGREQTGAAPARCCGCAGSNASRFSARNRP